MSYDSDKDISGLDPASGLAGGNYIAIKQGSQPLRKVSLANLSTYLKGTVDFDFAGALEECAAATTANLSATYNNGAGTLTATSNGAISIDGESLSSADRVLVKNQTNAYENGIYTVTTVGDGSNPYVLTRATDADSFSEFSETTVTVTAGSTYSGWTFWFSTETSGVIGTDSVDLYVWSTGQRNHDDLNGLSGGAASDYFHLTEIQHDTLTDGSDADSLHVHDQYTSKTVSLSTGQLDRDFTGVASSNRYVKITVPQDTNGDEFEGILNFRITIMAATGASYTSLSAPMEIFVNIYRNAGGVVAEASIEANYIGAIKVPYVYLYNNSGSDFIFIDLNNFNGYHCTVESIVSNPTSDILDRDTFAITTASTLTGTLVDTATPSQYVTLKAIPESEAVAYSGTIDDDCEDYTEKVFTTTATGDFTLTLSNPVAWGAYLHKIIKNTASDVTITLSGTWKVPQNDGYTTDTDVTLSGASGNIYLLYMTYDGTNRYINIGQ